jgi:hypothetical protein
MSQIFQNIIPPDIMFNFFKDICIYNTINNEYIFNYISYKKSIFLNTLVSFLLDCRPYYKNSKHKYTNIDCISYSSVTTVIRQICNINNISYTKKNKYINSKPDMVYTIHRDSLFL